MDHAQPEPLLTGDGSPTLYTSRFGEPYHSRHGAIQESRHVFLRMGWEALPPESTAVSVLEMGLGTGLNALLTVEAQQQYPGRNVHYTALEAYPLAPETWRQLTYPSLLEAGQAAAWFETIHGSTWEETVEIAPGFTFVKSNTLLEEFFPAPESYDLIYFDAFAPESQPELWTEAVFQKLFEATRMGGILVTYCAKGAVRRAMQAAGWKVSREQGPPGKREMLRAQKIV